MTSSSELSSSPSKPELLAQIRQMPRLRPRRRKQPTLGFPDGANLKQFIHTITHRNHSPSLRRLAVWYENDPGAPIEILETDTVELSLVPHPGVPSKDDDISKQIEYCRLPVAQLGSQNNFCSA